MYEPAEDSYLLLEGFEKLASSYKNKRRQLTLLEMGCGQSLIASSALKSGNFSLVVGVDIEKEAVDRCRGLGGAVCFRSDMFSYFESHKEGKLPLGLRRALQRGFDLITFNPPYLPSKGIKYRDVDGGINGLEVVKRFLRQARKYISYDGEILIITSSLNGRRRPERLFSEQGYSFSLVSSKKLFFESLFLYRLRKKRPDISLINSADKHLIGRGRHGVVFKIDFYGEEIAVKLANDKSKADEAIRRECKALKLVNGRRIGPALVSCSSEFVAYMFVRGTLLPDFIMNASPLLLRKTLKRILWQCYTLDRMHLSKEEFHHPLKHVFISPEGLPLIIDFERAHSSEKPKNVTQFFQFLMRHVFNREDGVIQLKHSPNHIKRLLVEYKKSAGRRESYRAFISLLSLLDEQGVHADNFRQRVFRVVSGVPMGRVSTYKEVARALSTKAFRAVGRALSTSKGEVPCYRIVRSDGSLGGFRGSPDNREKAKLLAGEGIRIKDGRIQDFRRVFFRLS